MDISESTTAGLQWFRDIRSPGATAVDLIRGKGREGKGREGKGREGKGTRRYGTCGSNQSWWSFLRQSSFLLSVHGNFRVSGRHLSTEKELAIWHVLLLSQSESQNHMAKRFVTLAWKAKWKAKFVESKPCRFGGSAWGGSAWGAQLGGLSLGGSAWGTQLWGLSSWERRGGGRRRPGSGRRRWGGLRGWSCPGP